MRNKVQMKIYIWFVILFVKGITNVHSKLVHEVSLLI